MATLEDARAYINERRTVASEGGRTIEMQVRWNWNRASLIFEVTIDGATVLRTESLETAWKRFNTKTRGKP